MSTQTQHVRVPKELYQRALDVSEKYGVTIGEALNLMSQGERREGTEARSPSDPVNPQGDDTQGQPNTTQETQSQAKAVGDAVTPQRDTVVPQGDASQPQTSDPKTSSLVAPAAAAAPVAQEIVVRHHHLIEDTRDDPERLDRLEQKQEEQEGISALLGAGYASHDAMIKDHLGQHAEGRRKFDTGQTLEAGDDALRDFLETTSAIGGRDETRLNRAYLKRLPPALRGQIEAEPDHDAAA